MLNQEFSRLLASGDTSIAKMSRKPKKPRRVTLRKAVVVGEKGEEGVAGEKPAHRKWKPKKNEDNLKDEGPQWRDRAKERRKGEGEYKQVAEEFEQHAEVSVEESKFLGGDMEHTHLVKGLDYALLGKVRGELLKHGKIEERRLEEMERRKDKKKKEFKTLVARKVFQTVVEALHPHHVQFQLRLSRMSRAISLGQRIRGAPATFQPGRMSYEFDINMRMGADDIPTIVYRSKDECEPMDWSKKPGAIHHKVISTLQTVLVDIKNRRRARKDEAVATKKKKMDPKDEDDIFQGAGGIAAVEDAADKKTAPKPLKSKSYFDDDFVPIVKKDDNDFHASDKFLGPKLGFAYKRGEKGLGYYREGKAKSSTEKTVKRVYARASEEDDAYGELFPNTTLFKHSAKEEREKAAADEKGKGKGKGRKKRVIDDDDEDEERPDKYATEAVKHQFGQTRLDAEGRKKKKLNEEQQWDKIEKMIEKGGLATSAEMDARAAKMRT